MVCVGDRVLGSPRMCDECWPSTVICPSHCVAQHPVSASVAYMYTVYIFGFFLSRCQFPKINVNLCNFVIPHWFSNPFVMYKICSLWPKLSHTYCYMYHHLFQGDFNLIFLNMCMVWKSFTPSVTNECKALNEFDALM